MFWEDLVGAEVVVYGLLNTMQVVGLVVASTDRSSRIHLGNTWRLHRLLNWEFAVG